MQFVEGLRPDHRLEDHPNHHRDSRPAGEDIGQGTVQGTAQSSGEAVHQTLAVRIAQRNLLRAERAARLARLRPAEAAPAEITPLGGRRDAPAGRDESPPDNRPDNRPEAAEDAGAALEDFLRALTGGMALAASLPVPPCLPGPGTQAGSEAGAVLHFQRPHFQRPTAAEPAARPDRIDRIERGALFAPDPACDLDRLAGAGPGLIWALRRAGLRRLDDLAPLEAGELAARLGPLGRLVPAAAWIATARAARPPAQIATEIATETKTGPEHDPEHDPECRDPGSTLRIW